MATMYSMTGMIIMYTYFGLFPNIVQQYVRGALKTVSNTLCPPRKVDEEDDIAYKPLYFDELEHCEILKEKLDSIYEKRREQRRRCPMFYVTKPATMRVLDAHASRTHTNFIDGDMIGELHEFGFLDNVMNVNRDIRRRLIAFNNKFDDVGCVEFTFEKIYNYITRNKIVDYIENGKPYIETEIVDEFGTRQNRAYFPGDIIKFPLTLSYRKIDESVLTLATVVFTACENKDVLGMDGESCITNEIDSVESESLHGESDKEEEGIKREEGGREFDLAVDSLMTQILSSIVTPSDTTPTNADEEGYTAVTENQTVEPEAGIDLSNVEIEFANKTNDVEVISDENEVVYAVDGTEVCSRWLLYKDIEVAPRLPMIIRDLIDLDTEILLEVQEDEHCGLRAFMDNSDVWGVSLRLEYSDGEQKHIILDKNGYHEEVVFKDGNIEEKEKNQEDKKIVIENKNENSP